VPGYLMWALTGPGSRLAGLAAMLPAAAAPSATLGPSSTVSRPDPAVLHRAALSAIRHWHRDLRRLVELATVEETMLVPVRTSVPVAPWPASRVTLLGDAIHAMSPARGSGANTALRDAALLAAELGAAARGDKPVLAAVADYEHEMAGYGFAALRAAQRAERAGRPF
jgi:2-polyprenyl-6-methoxyphenol hydroxylase-like FAD-dependent oxidoreductase